MKIKAIGAFLIFAIVLASPFLVALANGEILKGAPQPKLELPKNATKCVEDTEYMAANHMNILKEEREQAVRRGIRTKKHSLKNCFTCHTDKSKFCDRCHTYAGVQPTCFAEVGGCHYAPTSKKQE